MKRWCVAVMVPGEEPHTILGPYQTFDQAIDHMRADESQPMFTELRNDAEQSARIGGAAKLYIWPIRDDVP